VFANANSRKHFRGLSGHRRISRIARSRKDNRRESEIARNRSARERRRARCVFSHFSSFSARASSISIGGGGKGDKDLHVSRGIITGTVVEKKGRKRKDKDKEKLSRNLSLSKQHAPTKFQTSWTCSFINGISGVIRSRLQWGLR